MQTFLLALVLLSIAAAYYKSYQETIKDAIVGPASMTTKEWFKQSALSMAFCVACYVALVLKIDISFILKTAETGTEGTSADGAALTITGAIALGLAIYKGVQMVIMPAIGFVTGAKSARKKLREKVATELNS